MVGECKLKMLIQHFAEGSGKTSLIFTLLEDCFVDKVPPNIETVIIPPETSPDQVITAIVDYSRRLKFLKLE
jgi:GTPase SAR1 family protein